MKLLLMSMGVALAACAVPVRPPADAGGVPAPAATPAPVVPASATGVVARAGEVVLTGERGFAVAELAYLTAADGVGRLADEGLIAGAAAGQVRGWNAEARRWLVRGKAAADAAEKARAATALFGFADKLNALRGK